MNGDAEHETADDPAGAGGSRGSSVLGAQLGAYRVEQVLARGGMGIVFRGRRVHDRVPVAIKVLTAGPRATEVQRLRFEREARLVAALDHPDIVRVLDVGVHQGHPWIALELVEGGTLADLLPRLAPRALVELVARVARAIGHAHRQGVIHRDLKPSNVLIREGSSEPVVTDFGLARDLTQTSDLTRSGITLGTPLYMAPEQVHARPATPATDVYALGVLLYEGLAGVPPFDDGDGILALYAAICSQPPAPPSTHRDVPPGLDRIVLRALAKEPEQRFPHADALAVALEAWLADEAVGPRSSGALAAGVVGLGVLGALVLGLVGAKLQAAPPAPSPVGSATPTPDREPTPTPAPAATPAVTRRLLVLQPGPVDGIDTTIRNDGLYLNDNFGNGSGLLLGDRAVQRGDFRALLRFDLSRLPAGATIYRAKLALALRSNRLERPIRVEVRRLVETRNADGQGKAQTPWVEGAGGRDRALDGVCWEGDHPRGRFPEGRSYMPQFTQPRAAPGPPLSAIPLTPRELGWIELDVTAAVRRWTSKPASNHGLRVSHAPEGRPWNDGRVMFASSDNAHVDQRPRLAIEYDGLPAAPAPDPDALLARAREAAAAQLRIVTSERGATPRALAAAQRACELAPFWGEPYFHRGRLRVRRYADTSSYADFGLAEHALIPYRAAALYLERGRELLRLGHPAQALQDAARAKHAGATEEAARLRHDAQQQLTVRGR